MWNILYYTFSSLFLFFIFNYYCFGASRSISLLVSSIFSLKSLAHSSCIFSTRQRALSASSVITSSTVSSCGFLPSVT